MVYKNIRITMKSGKTRLQRVKVLASGKYKFVKNIGKRIRSATRRSSNPTRKRGGRKRMVRRWRRRRRGGGGKSITRTAFKFMRLGALVAPGAYYMLRGGDIKENVAAALSVYTGYDIRNGSFNAGRLAQGWGPYLMSCVTTYGIPKATSMIRRM